MFGRPMFRRARSQRLLRLAPMAIVTLLGASLATSLAAQPYAVARAAALARNRGGCFTSSGRDGREQNHSAPAGSEVTRIDRDGETIIPNGRLLTPAGNNVTVAPHPFGLALSPDGQTLISANSGTDPFSLSVVSEPGSAEPSVRQIPPGADTDPAVLNAVFMGLAVAGDNRTLYVSGGNDGNIAIFDLVSGERSATIDLNVPAAGRDWRDSYIGDLKLSPDGKMVWAVDQANFRLVGVDVASRTVAKVAPTGRYPFGVTLSPDGRRAYVANVGMYEYSFVEGFDPENATATGLSFPPFAQDSLEARVGAIVEGKTVPGLGDPNAPESFSVWAIDLADAKPIAKLKTGPLVGELVEGIPAVGGSSPNSVVNDGQRVFVSNNHSDSIAVIDMRRNQVVKEIKLVPDRRLSRLRGVMPFGLALSPDAKILFAAESGINAIAVIDTRTLEVLGHIPSGWFPAKVEVAPDGRHLYVSNAKGYGSGPNGGVGYVPGPEGTYIGAIQKGTIQLIDIPDFSTANGRKRLVLWTSQVLRNNGFVAERWLQPRDRAQESPCPIDHVIFVTKENRTYDEVLGDLGAVGNRAVNADASLARYGQPITPNHHALARRFAHSDNFYVDSDVSADGHRWLVGVAPDEFVETSWAASYGGRRDFRYDLADDSAPGRRGFTEANSALAPEDYPEAGSIWDHFDRNDISFRNYGEGFEFAGIYENADLEPTGARLPVNVPMPGPLFRNTNRNFPTYNTNISDQYRVDVWEDEFKQRYIDGGEVLPRFVNIYLPQDHTAGPRPENGYPTREAYVADNDLALGRVVDLVSHSKYWRSTAIFVTEDDAQSGVDHVDAHRSLLLAISPWTKRSYVSGEHTSMVSIIKTINQLTGAPMLNLYDALATDLSSMFNFNAAPDLQPYTAVPIDPAVFDPSKVKRGGFTAEELHESEELDSVEDISELHDEELERERDQTVDADD